MRPRCWPRCGGRSGSGPSFCDVRVALLNPSYWPEVRRGSERVVHDLAVTLAGRGHEVTILTSHPGRRSVDLEEGFTVVRSRRPRRISLLHPYEDHLVNVPSVVRELRPGRFDIAHAFHPADAWAACHARRLGGPPLVFSFHGTPAREYLVARRYRLEMLQRVVHEAAAVTVLSEAAAAPFRRYLLREPEIVPGAVLRGRFTPSDRRADRPTLACAADLRDPRKRGPLLVAAFAQLRLRRPDARLVLLSGVAGATQADGIETNAVRDDKKLARAYGEAWATVLPAAHEAFGLVLIESLAAGTPVVAANSGSCREIVTDEAAGTLFEPDDESAMVTAMDRTLELANRPTTVERCVALAARYDADTVAELVERIYAQTLGRASTAA